MNPMKTNRLRPAHWTFGLNGGQVQLAEGPEPRKWAADHEMT